MLGSARGDALSKALGQYYERRKKRVALSQKRASVYGRLYKPGGNSIGLNGVRNGLVGAIPDTYPSHELNKMFTSQV
ncbi:MAG TPA: hypothetical protein VMS08_01450 [Candidatus Saccharimonadia bacterium]|nr:hypothetical protein [Candidatus Saccharimonadia bacterium]